MRRRIGAAVLITGLVVPVGVVQGQPSSAADQIRQPQSNATFAPDEPRVELLLQANTDDGQVMASIEHTIGERLGALGLPKWSVTRPEGGPPGQLLVLLPRDVNVARVKRVIGSADLLEFRLVEQGPVPSKEALQVAAGQVPQRLDVLPGIVEADGHPSTVYYLLQRTPVITGSDLRSARPLPDENNKPAISFSLNQEGARKLGKATGENIGHRMAIVLDGQVRSAPTIDSRITSDGRITGSFTQQETQDLSLILNSGALAAPVTVIGERFIEGR